MNRARRWLCLLGLACLIPLALAARRRLPVDTRPLVAERYAGWSGVLRLWVFEGWQPGAGSLAPWLNRCAARFEKRHPGVYVQPRYVDAGAIAAMNEDGMLSPDMALFPPGLLEEPEGLLALEVPGALRPALAGVGSWRGAVYAIPVAMGGYMWVWNAARIDGIPESWRDSGAVPASPEPEPWRRWDAALLALCAGQAAQASPGAEAAPGGGPDLGLPEAAVGAPPPAADAGEGAPSRCRLPEGFRPDGDAWRRFVNGEADALAVTQREVRRLQALSDSGRGPDWRLSAGGAAFTDQLLCLGVAGGTDAGRRALCVEFLDCLLEEESQRELYARGAFGVTGAAGGFGAGDPLAALDAALRAEGLLATGCFGAALPERASEIVRDFIAGGAEAGAAWPQFEALVRKNTND